MKKPDNREMIPPGDWTIIFPGTGHRISSNHPSAFLQKCHEHMELNDIPIMGGWQDEMFNLACEQNPAIPCHEVGVVERSIASEDIWRFLTTLWNARGEEAVSEEEAERRVGICVTCPRMTHVACTMGCGKLAEVLTTLTLGRTPKRYTEVHKASCGVCGCEISSLVNYPLDVLKKVDEKLNFKIGEYPSHCWKLENNLPDVVGDELQPLPPVVEVS